ncbi:MAG: TadE/TadG family type IV pilus assembly protein [Terracidiphilus sp.]
MKNNFVYLVRRALRDQRGQVMPWVIFGMIGMLSMAGVSVDVGRAYSVRNQLQNAVNAAALAGSAEVYNTSSTNDATSVANSYLTLNNNTGLTLLSGYGPTTLCLNALMPAGQKCTASTPSNAIRVKAAVQVPTSIIAVLGLKYLTVGATATATMGIAQPWNVAIIMDGSGSMATTDSNCGGVTEFQCAMNGIQTLLSTTNPCSSSTTCNFRVGLFSFPSVSTATVADEYNCSGGHGTTPTFMQYSLPLTTASSYSSMTYTEGSSTWDATYNILYNAHSVDASGVDANGFATDYYQPSASNGLNSSSPLVKAITGCMQPMTNFASSGTGHLSLANCTKGSNGCSWSGSQYYYPGVTYYASAIYAAQAALVAEQAAMTTAGLATKNAIIFLSDGQANLVSNYFAWGTSPKSTISGTSGLDADTTTGLYPSATDECQQAIIAAQEATKAGTTVFGVAYGSEQTGCATAPTGGGAYTDTSLIASSNYPLTLNQSFSLSTLTPCVTIENIASSMGNFYSDYNQSGTGVDLSCVDSSHTVSSLDGIFSSIASTFKNPHLIPNTAQ